MPSASTNSNNKNKLMKQASFGCSSGNGGGGGGGPGGSQSSTSVTAATVVNVIPIATKTPAIGAAAANVLTAETNNNSNSISATITANNNGGNINTDSNVSCNNNSLSSTLATGKGGEKSSSVAAAPVATTVGAVTNESTAGNPMRQALITIEHKIRNLEKRKTKLESYRLIQANGKELSSDQKAAVAKYDAVMATLEFARDLSKQMMQFSKDAEKEQKKQARKDLIAKAQAETAKIREVLIIQNILSCFTDDSVRSDFMNGENGAIKLQRADLDAVEQFCFDIQTRRPESVDDPSFVSVAQKAAEYFSMTIDGRPKQYGDTTFENLRRVFNQIQDCGYLDKIYLVASDASNIECNDEEGVVPNPRVSIAEEENSTRVSNSLEENMEKLSVAETGSHVRNATIITYANDAADLPEQQQQQVVGGKEQQIDLIPKPNTINAMSMPPPPPPQALHMPGVGNFVQASSMPPPPNRQQSGSTTPVHVTAMFAPQGAGGPPQPVPPPPMQQVVPPNAAAPALIAGMPPQQPNPVATMTSQHRAGGGVNVQLPPGVAPALPPPGAPYPLTTVRAVEQDFFKQHQQQQQQQQQQQKYVQQMRPLAEVIGAGSFYFLQDSELDSPEIGIGSANNSGSGASVAFEPPAPNLLVHVSDVPLTAAAVDMQQQQQSKKLAAQQQSAPPQPQQQQQSHPPHQPPQQQQIDAQHQVLQQQQQQQAPPPQPQSQQQPPLPQSQPITTQTFTNQTFPPIQPQQQAQPPTQLQRHENTATPATAAVVAAAGGPVQAVSNKTASMNSGSNGNTPTAQLFQQPQLAAQQQGPQSKVAAMYSPDLVMAAKGVLPPPPQQQQPPIMIMTRLATPQARIPIPAGGNVQPPLPQQQQQQQPPPPVPHAPGFQFETMVASFGSYEQQVQHQLAAVATGAQKHAVATGGASIPNAEGKNRKMSGASADPSADPSGPAQVVNNWETNIKGGGNTSSRNAVNNSNAAKAAALTSALKQHSSGSTSVGNNQSQLEPAQNTNKWSTEMNALSVRGNSPPPSSNQHHTNSNANANNANNQQQQQQQQNRKNDWSNTAGSGNSNSNVGGNYNDVAAHSDNGGSSNHWNTNQSQQHDNNTTSGGFGRGGRNSNNAYQRRNDDRRGGDRGAGGGGGGGNNYRNRSNNNYGGSGSQSSQPNGGGRGGGGGGNSGGGGIYFRNNSDNAQSGGAPNSFYQNGGLYAKDGAGNAPRYDNRGPRGGGSNNQRNQGPTRNMGRNSGSSGSNNSVGGGGGGGAGYMHSRQTNRMPMGLEKN